MRNRRPDGRLSQGGNGRLGCLRELQFDSVRAMSRRIRFPFLIFTSLAWIIPGCGGGDSDVSSECSSGGETSRISDEQIDETVRVHLDELQSCFDEAFSRGAAEGTVSVTVTVASGGDVTDVTIAPSPTMDEELADCVRGGIFSWNFPLPEPAGDVVVTLEFPMARRE